VHTHSSAYVSIRSIRHSMDIRQLSSASTTRLLCLRQHSSACASIRQHTSAYVSIMSLDVHPPALLRLYDQAAVSIREHTSAYVKRRQHT
jgi:hypothetical protein